MMMRTGIAAVAEAAEGTLARFLREARERAGYSSPERVQEAAAQRGYRVSGRTIRQIEAGGTGRPEPETLEILAVLYRLDFADVLRRAGHPMPHPMPLREVTDRAHQVASLFDRLTEGDKAAIERLVERLAGEWEDSSESGPASP